MKKYKHIVVVIKGGSFNWHPYYTYHTTDDYANSGWFANSFRIIKII